MNVMCESRLSVMLPGMRVKLLSESGGEHIAWPALKLRRLVQVHGTCLGFETLAVVVSGNTSILGTCVFHESLLSLGFVFATLESAMPTLKICCPERLNS